MYYLKQSYKAYLTSNEPAESLDDKKLYDFMSKYHPRFYELFEKYNFSLQSMNEQRDMGHANIKSKVVEVKLISEVEATHGKTLKKKLLPTMTVENLKGIC